MNLNPFRRNRVLTDLPATSERQVIGFDEWVNWFSYGGLQYPILQTSLGGEPTSEMGTDFESLGRNAYKQNGVVFACMLNRQLVFQEARFQFRTRKSGRPGEYFGTRELDVLEHPWPGGTTGDLLARAMQDVDLAGNFYAARRNVGGQRDSQLRRLHPQYVSIGLTSRVAPKTPRFASDVEILGYSYKPPDQDPEIFAPDEVMHFHPTPDPDAHFRGMSWLNPVVAEILGDQAASTHKLKFFEQGATPNFIVRFEPSVDKETVDAWIAAMEAQIGGAANAYRTLYLGGGADAKVIGANLKDVDFKSVQGAGETRIAAAAGVPPIIVGLSEGLESATYSNYSQARRRFADATLRPLWRNFAASAETIIRVPRAAELWYDDRDIPFLAEDQADAADVLSKKSAAIKLLTDAGYDASTVIEAVEAGDLSRLAHTGLFSVQLRPPGENEPAPAVEGGPPMPPQLPAAPSNGGRSRAARLPAAIGGTDAKPHGEAALRSSIAAFERAEGDVRELVRREGNVTERRDAALAVLRGLRDEPVDDHLADAYSDAFESALDRLDGKEPRAEINADVAALGQTLREKVHGALDEAERRTGEAFTRVGDGDADKLADQAVVGHVDVAGREWSFAAYGSNQMRTLGRRATSRGVKDAAGGGMVQVSEHGSNHPICSQLEGQTFPAFMAPEPPFHEGCQHYLVPVQ